MSFSMHIYVGDSDLEICSVEDHDRKINIKMAVPSYLGHKRENFLSE